MEELEDREISSIRQDSYCQDHFHYQISYHSNQRAGMTNSITLTALEIQRIAAYMGLINAEDGARIETSNKSGIGTSVSLHLTEVVIDVTDYDSW